MQDQSRSSRKKIGIIGAGIAGLGAAVRLAAQGHAVEVFEANAYAGGKLSEFQLGGYRFDAGPSLFTMPHYVDELFTLAGQSPAAHFHYDRLPIVCNYFWEDQTRLSAYADAHAFAAEAESKLGVPATRLLALLADSQRKYELTGRIFLEKSLHRWDTWLQPEVVRAMAQIWRFDLFTSMNAVHERLVQHPKLVQLFNRFATYNGSNPYRAPGLLSIIPHFEHHLGAYYPRGGMYQITRQVQQLAESLGVVFHFNTPVEEIQVRQGQAVGLKVNGVGMAYDQILSNMDVFYTYRKLLPREKHPEKVLRQEKSTSALIFYWGIAGYFPELQMHNIFFSENYRQEFDHLARGEVYTDPTVYVNLTTGYSPEDAPAGCQNWFTMVNVPYNAGQDWDAIIARTREQVLAKLSRILGRNVAELIEEEALLDPRSIEQKTWSHLGALYGTSSNNRMAAFWRHPNHTPRLKNLYFCGGSVHPGGGIPLALLSAKIATRWMQEQH